MISESQARKYCGEDISLIENYAEAVSSSEKWEIHHRLEIQGKFRNSKRLLIKCGMYWKVPAWQLVFMKESEHRKMHRTGGGFTDDARRRMSERRRGRIPWNKGIRRTPEEKSKMSEARRGKGLGSKLPDWHRRRIALAVKEHWKKRRRRLASLRENPLYEPGGPRQ